MSSHGASNQGSGRSLGSALRGTDSYVLLATLLVADFLVLPLAGQGRLLALALLAYNVAIVVFALHTSGIRRRRIWLLLTAGLAAVVGVSGWSVWFGVLPFSLGALRAALYFVAIVVIARRVAAHRLVTIKTVMGAVSIYLLLGFMFAGVYESWQFFAGQPFFAAPQHASCVRDPGAPLPEPCGTAFELLYFSFVTLTTLGYGDFAPGNDVGRSLAVAEAIIGQVFLITAVARLVGTVGTRRPGAS